MEYIYIFRSYIKDGTLLKFGYTADIWSRLAGYKSANPGIEIVYIAQLADAYKLEQAFHTENPAIAGNEWYDETLLPIMIDYLNSVPHIDYTNEDKPIPKSTFKEIVERCRQNDIEYLNWACSKYDFLEKAVQCLGYDRIEKLQYNSNLIKKALVQFSDTDGVKEMLDVDWNVQKGMFISNDILKEMFKEVYAKLNIKKAAKAIDITKYGEGLQRVFEIALLLGYCKNGILCIDEIDSALHKSLLIKFTEFIQQIAKEFNVQVFLSTHSKECIDAFVENEFPDDELTAYALEENAEGKIECNFLLGNKLKQLVETINIDIR